MSLKNGEATGLDEIPAVAIKASMETIINMLHNFFSKIWKVKQTPADLKEGILIKLPYIMVISRTAATTEKSCSCQCLAKS